MTAFLGTSLWVKENYIDGFTRVGIKSVKNRDLGSVRYEEKILNRKFCSCLAEESAKLVSIQ